jgi:hypothetical protein
MNRKDKSKTNISYVFIGALCFAFILGLLQKKHSPDGGTSTARGSNFRNVLFLRTPDAFCYRRTQSAKKQRW